MYASTISQAAAAVRGQRKRLHLTQAALASRAGVSRKWVYEFESGNPGAELGALLGVLDALGLRLDFTAQEPVMRVLHDLDRLLGRPEER